MEIENTLREVADELRKTAEDLSDVDDVIKKEASFLDTNKVKTFLRFYVGK